MRRIPWLLSCLLLVSIVSGAAALAEPQSVVRFGGSYVMPSGDLTLPFSFAGEDLGDGTMLAFDGSLTVEAQDSAALTVGYEFRASRRLGFEVSLLSASADVDGRLLGDYWINDSSDGMLIETGRLDQTEGIGDVSFVPLTFGVDFHLTPDSRLDLYVAPLIGWVFFGDLDVSDGGGKIGLDDTYSYGATVGLDVPLGGGGWLFGGALRYLAISADFDDPDFGSRKLDVDPLVVQVAVGYRF